MSVLTNSTPITVASEEALKYVPYVHCPVQFRKDSSKTKALINSGSEINVMSPAYIKKLGLWIRKTDVGAQKIDGSCLNTFRMVIAGFQIQNKLGKARFF